MPFTSGNEPSEEEKLAFNDALLTVATLAAQWATDDKQVVVADRGDDTWGFSAMTSDGETTFLVLPVINLAEIVEDVES